MKFSLGLFLTMGLALIAGCATSALNSDARKPAAQADPYIWLEDVHSDVALKWVKEHNEKSKSALTPDPHFKEFSDEIRTIITAKDRIPFPAMRNGMYRNFWQDAKNVRGLWRETTFEEYKKDDPQWQTILDLDALNKTEGKSWVWGGSTCFAPQDNLCLIKLSSGGSDTAVMREFDVAKRAFVADGFELPLSKAEYSWVDENTLIVSTDFGPGTLTKSGYPRQVKIWKRHTPLGSAQLIFEGKETDVSVSGYRNIRPESANMFVIRGVSFSEQEAYLYEKGKLQLLPFPKDSDLQGDFQGFLMVRLRTDWKTSAKTYVAGSLLSLPLKKVGAANFEKYLEAIYVPDSRSTLSSIATTKNFLFLNILKDVKGQVLRTTHHRHGWKSSPFPLPKNGMANIVETTNFSNDFLADFTTFTVPTTLYFANGDHPEVAPVILKQTPARYDASDIVFEQMNSVSADGTKVPYFVVHKKGMKLDGTNPTLLYAYGGFEVSMTPFYMGAIGKVWLERGGIYVLANIRGGGEFGPQWHEAALKENRQHAYDDFASVSEDLIKRNITTTKHLGIMGGSNGGLLMGVAFTEHPELYSAVVCESALLDMLRFHLLPPGASWIGEYGNPDDPKMAAIIAQYSPYQNIRPGVKYPKVFFHTSTGDDRVQPGHTRKVVARLEEYGNNVLLYENNEGGHGGAADLEAGVTKMAMEYTYLFQLLF